TKNGTANILPVESPMDLETRSPIVRIARLTLFSAYFFNSDANFFASFPSFPDVIIPIKKFLTDYFTNNKAAYKPGNYAFNQIFTDSLLSFINGAFKLLTEISVFENFSRIFGGTVNKISYFLLIDFLIHSHIICLNV